MPPMTAKIAKAIMQVRKRNLQSRMENWVQKEKIMRAFDDRQFTPLEQSLDEILEICWPNIGKAPASHKFPTIMGRFMRPVLQISSGSRAWYRPLFRLKNIVQEYRQEFLRWEWPQDIGRLSQSSQQKSSNQQKVQHDGRNQDRKMAPLDQILESFLVNRGHNKIMIRIPEAHFTLLPK